MLNLSNFKFRECLVTCLCIINEVTRRIGVHQTDIKNPEENSSIEKIKCNVGILEHNTESATK